MHFQQPAIVSLHTISHTDSPWISFWLLLSNTSFGYWQQLNQNKITFWKCRQSIKNGLGNGEWGMISGNENVDIVLVEKVFLLSQNNT